MWQSFRRVTAMQATLLFTLVLPARSEVADVKVGVVPPSGFAPALEFPDVPPKVVWKYVSPIRVQGERAYSVGIAEPAVAHGRVYFGDDDGVLRALDSKTGDLIWTRETLFRISNRPTVDDLFVYAGNDVGLLAIDYKSGQLAWQLPLHPGAGEADPVMVGNRLMFSAYDGFAYAVDRTDGGVEWKTSLMEDLPAEPRGFTASRARFQKILVRPNGASTDGELFFQSIFDQSRIVAIDVKSGDLRWSFETQGWTSPAATMAAGDRLLIGSQAKHLYCLNRKSGKLLWSFKTGSRVSSQVAVAEDRAFLPSVDGFLYCLNVDDGSLVWKFKTLPEKEQRTSIYSFPLVTKSQVLFAAAEGQVYAVSRETGELIWRMRPVEDSEAYTSLSTDGQRLFAVIRQDIDNNGECAIVALGWNQ